MGPASEVKIGNLLGAREGQAAQEAEGPEGEGRVEESEPGRSYGQRPEEPGGQEPAGPEGGALGVEDEWRGEKQLTGQLVEVTSEKNLDQPSSRDRYYRGRDEKPHYLKRVEERRLKDTEPVSSVEESHYQLEKKPQSVELDEEAGESSAETSDFVTALEPELQFRQPTIRFSCCASRTSRCPSQRFLGPRVSGISVINELAMMGDPHLLQMVEEGRRPPRGAGDGRAAPGSLQP